MRRRVTERLGILAGVAVYYLAGYFGIAWANAGRHQHTELALSFEHLIPFVPAFSIPYSLVYPAIALGYLSIPVSDIRLFRRGALAFIATLTACFIVFVVFPVTIDRPPPPLGDGWGETVTAFWFFLDPRTNLFPSLHVGLSVISALVGWRHNRTIGVVTMVFAVLVAVSTLFLRQHYVVDVLAGAAVAAGAYWTFVAREAPREAMPEAEPV